MSSSDAAPGGDGQHQLELQPVKKPPLPIEDDLMQLARLGELRSIQKLFDSGRYNPNSSDDQGITPLHWAAINGHYALCHFLLQAGADPNQKGGDALATPVLWASKKCQLDVVNLLLQNGADPLITDDAGYNLLHCATLDGNVFQLILLLHQPELPVDVPDSQGHTSLMWAAYKGFPACVDVLLKWGASVNAKDQQGFTALHWALVKGNATCIQRLVEYGADRFVANNEGKTPAVTAKEMNSVAQWHRALQESGYNRAGDPREFPIGMVEDKRKFLWRLFFAWPTVVLGSCFYLASSWPIFIGLPAAIVALGGLQWAVLQLLRWGPPGFNHVQNTPYFAGVFTATLLWVGIQYLTVILPNTYSALFFTNISFLAAYLSTAYFYFSSMLADPGFVPKSGSRGQSKEVVEDLIGNRAFDEKHFCSICMIRKPLRSKHCRNCGRCVAREDHHCPWLDNCVAVNNHKHFLLYIISLLLGITLYDRLFLEYIAVLPPLPTPPQCTVLSADLCASYSKDPFTSVLTIWATLQLIWTCMLLSAYLTQIARAMTTYEAMRGHRVTPLASAITTGSADPTLTGAQPTPTPTTDAAAPTPKPPQKKQPKSWWQTAKRLLGLEAVLATAMYGSKAHARRAADRANPYNRGVVGNCADFWGPTDGEGGTVACLRGLGQRRSDGLGRLGGVVVDYRRLYVVPDGGMRYRRGGYESVPGEAEEV